MWATDTAAVRRPAAGARGGTVGGAQVVGGPEGADDDDAERVERVVDHRDVDLPCARAPTRCAPRTDMAADCSRVAGDGAGALNLSRTPAHLA